MVSTKTKAPAKAVCHAGEKLGRNENQPLSSAPCAFRAASSASARSIRGQNEGLSEYSRSSFAATLSDFQLRISSAQSGQEAACASRAAHSAGVPSSKIRSRSLQVTFIVFHRISAALLRGGFSIWRRFFFAWKSVFFEAVSVISSIPANSAC